MKDIFKQIFKGQPVVSDTKLDTELTEQMTEQMAEEAFEQFLSEGDLQPEIEKPVLRSVPLDDDEETESFFDMRSSNRGVDSRDPDNNTPEASFQYCF